jgi:hypothetical protein
MTAPVFRTATADDFALFNFVRSVREDVVALRSGRWFDDGHHLNRIERPGFLSPILRSRFDEAVAFARRPGVRTTASEFAVLPAWYLSNEDDESSEWELLHVVFSATSTLDEMNDWPSPRAILARGELISAPVVTLARHYAPSISLPYRNDSFAVVDRRTVVPSEIRTEIAIEPLPKPTRALPAWSLAWSPAMRDDWVPAPFREQLAAMLSREIINGEAPL